MNSRYMRDVSALASQDQSASRDCTQRNISNDDPDLGAKRPWCERAEMRAPNSLSIALYAFQSSMLADYSNHISNLSIENFATNPHPLFP